MTRQIDIALFIETVGELDVLASIGSAFLGQLGPWRLAMQRHSECFDGAELNRLVHRMKSSCYAVSAAGAAAEFNQAEAALKHMHARDWPPVYASLMALIKEIEAELQSLAKPPHQPHNQG